MNLSYKLRERLKLKGSHCNLNSRMGKELVKKLPLLEKGNGKVKNMSVNTRIGNFMVKEQKLFLMETNM